MNEELSKVHKMGVKRVGIQGVRAQAREAMRDVDPLKCAHRLAIGFDDSGSMGIQPLADAKKAVAGFLACCIPTETSVAVVPFSGIDGEHGVKAQSLTNQYDLINMYLGPIKATSSTPLYGTMKKMMSDFDITRGILFSDGGSTDKAHSNYTDSELGMCEEDSVLLAIEKKIPFDTVSIGGPSTELKHIADITGGVYLEFMDTSIFAKSMKYLSPRYVALLSNAELKAKVERGETI